MLTRTGAGQKSTPLVASEQVKLTVTLLLFHPAAFGKGLTLDTIIGATLSTPIICNVRLSSGFPLSTTDNWFVARRVTGFVNRVMVALKSFWVKMSTPLSVITALDTFALSIRNV